MRIKNKEFDLWMVFYYFKSGFVGITFALTAINFLLLSYNFSIIKEYLTMWQFACIFMGFSAVPLIFFGRYSWQKGELRKSLDAGIANNPFLGAQSRAWIKFIDGDLEGSKKEIEPYLECGGKK